MEFDSEKSSWTLKQHKNKKRARCFHPSQILTHAHTPKAYDWIKKIDRNDILQLDAFTFVVPSKEPQKDTHV